MAFQIALITLTLTATIAAAQQAVSPSIAQAGIYSAAQAKRGASLYQKHCSSCHGTESSGSEGAPPLRGADFDMNWNGTKLTDLFDRIKTTMPQTAPGSLTDEQYADVLAFILSMNDVAVGSNDLAPRPEVLGGLTYKARAR